MAGGGGGVGGVAAAHGLRHVRRGCGGCWAYLVRTVRSSAVLSQRRAENLLIKLCSYAGLAGREAVIGKYYFFFLENTRGSGPKIIFIKRLRKKKSKKTVEVSVISDL